MAAQSHFDQTLIGTERNDYPPAIGAIEAALVKLYAFERGATKTTDGRADPRHGNQRIIRVLMAQRAAID